VATYVGAEETRYVSVSFHPLNLDTVFFDVTVFFYVVNRQGVATIKTAMNAGVIKDAST